MSRRRVPFAVWQRSVRRALRDWVRDHGQVPALAALVSVGSNPRKLEAQMRLDLLPDELVVKARMQGLAWEHGSRFAAYAGLLGEDAHPEHEGGWRVLALTCVSPDEVAVWAAPVHPLYGLGVWEEGSFRAGDFGFLQKTLAEAAA